MTTEILNNFKIETEREDDGRWIAEIPELPGVLVYGNTEIEAITNVKALALRVIADKMEHGEITLNSISFIAA
jgi:predicted RNase H-like HicB family nuclease